MKQTATTTPQDWREGRRLRAWELYQQGWKQRAIAQALGVSEGAVSQWLTRAVAGGGPAALRHRRGGGPKPRLTAAQRAQLPALLARGAEAYGFRGDVWTRKRVATVVQREFGVRYHPSHIGRLLQAIGWSLQKPLKRATQRDEQAIQTWKDERWPAIKQADDEQRTLVWVDEAGFYLLPAVVRTYAPRGHTPVLRAKLTRDHLAAISAITSAGKLYLSMQTGAYKSVGVVRFLKHLLRQIPGKLVVLWDGAPIHRGQPVKDFLATELGQRLQLERLPGYAPELNPDEGVWQRLKYSELKNVCCATLQELRRELRLATARLRHKRDSLRGCIRQVGYAL